MPSLYVCLDSFLWRLLLWCAALIGTNLQCFCRFWRSVLARNCRDSFVAVLSGGVLFRIRAYKLCRSFVCAVDWVTGRRSE